MKSKLIVIALSILLSACGNNSGSDTQVLPNSGETISETYTGPAPATEDTQRFKLYVWDNLMAANRCGSCHGTDGQAPTFVQHDDVNLAYVQANSIVNLTTPQDSLMVTKVAGGHNCWLDSDAACADTLTRYIEAWSSETAGSQATVQLEAPELKDPGTTKTFPEDSASFESAIHPLLTQYCADCHSEDSTFPQSPYFASTDAAAAYSEVKSKIDLDTPANSRLVIRLRDEFHNCWDDCTSNAAEMLAAIETFTANIVPSSIDPDLVTSKALSLGDGTIASSGGRFEENVIALFEFKTGEGATAYDTSGIEPAMNLTLTGDVEWVGGWGLKINDGKAQATTLSSRKLHEQILATGEYTLETWIAPANVTQEGPAVIASYSAGNSARNFTLGQTLYTYDFRQRSNTTNANGEPALTTSDDDEDAQATLQHVVVTYSPSNGRQVFVNGENTGDVDEVTPGILNDWDNTYAFVIGNEVSNNRLWKGTVRMLAIHNRALTEAQINANFEVGVGQKFYLLFSTEHLSGIEQSYVVFEVSQFDSYSYLFGKPFFVSLDDGAEITDTRLEGLRIGINGHLASTGQAYSNLAVDISSSNYTSDKGQPLSSLGTIIAVEKGPEADEFFLTFDRLGEHTNVTVNATPPASELTPPDSEYSAIGIRNFDEINASMARITGISPSDSDIQQTFTTIKQQLPNVSDINTFVSAQQMAITQLAIQYCHAVVEDNTQRQAFFGDFDFNQSPSVAFDSEGRIEIANLLYEKIAGTELESQPTDVDVINELDALMVKLSNCNGSCAADRTATIMKASCAAVLGSAVTLIK